MEKESGSFGEISLLITHFNRSSSLERLLKSFDDKHIRFNEILVSDDCSKPEHINRLEVLKVRYRIQLVLAPKNKGLANNINKGQRAVKSAYTLYVQEDFVPTDKFLQSLSDGLKLIKDDKSIDLIRFYAYRKHPFLKPVRDEFSEMKFHFWYPNESQFHCYSDHPHLRRSDFLEKFGNYKEGIKSDRAEFRMVISFLQHKGKALIHNDYRNIFIQENSAQEPSQVQRKKIRNKLQGTKSLPVRIVRFVYRNLKFRYEYLFMKNK